MKRWLAAAAVALTGWGGMPQAPAFAQATAGALASDGLSALEAMTFRCPKAGLNAAAREAGKVPSQGTYQFAYFKIISDSHHAAYEVHFKSNYAGEADLKYCVNVYCQQGWDPTAKTSVTVMTNSCGHQPAPAKQRLKR